MGIRDSYTTGQVLHAVSLIYPFYHRQLFLYPVFDEKILDAEGSLRGRIRLSVILWLVRQVLVDGHTGRMLKDVYKRQGEDPMVAGAIGKKPLSIAIDELYHQKVKILPEEDVYKRQSWYRPLRTDRRVPSSWSGPRFTEPWAASREIQALFPMKTAPLR